MGATKTLAGSIAKTEAGDGMFGADIELESLTDSDSDSPDHEKKRKAPKQGAAKFEIVAGEDSDSIFEERLQ